MLGAIHQRWKARRRQLTASQSRAEREHKPPIALGPLQEDVGAATCSTSGLRPVLVANVGLQATSARGNGIRALTDKLYGDVGQRH